MRARIIAVNIAILLVVGLLAYALLYTSLESVVADPAERKLELEQALRSANAALTLDAVRLERWLARKSEAESVRATLSDGVPSARADAATAEANRLRDAAVVEAEFAGMAPSLVLFVDPQGVALGRNGSTLMRGMSLAGIYPSLGEALRRGGTSSAIWVDRARQEQLLVAISPVRVGVGAPTNDTTGDGVLLGAVVVGTPLNDERLSRTSQLAGGHPLVLGVLAERSVEMLARSHDADAALVRAAVSSALFESAQRARALPSTLEVEGLLPDARIGAIPLAGYAGPPALLVTAVPASAVGSISGLLWPIFAVTALGVLLVIAAGVLLGNYLSGPISEIEDGLLAVINGNTQHRFQLEHDVLGGLVFRINSLLNQLMGVPEDTTDEQGRPSHPPRARDFREALSVDESAVSIASGGLPSGGPLDGQAVDPALAAALASEPADRYYRRLYESYLEFRRKLGDPIEGLTLESFVARIEASERELGQKYGRPVRYLVELRGDAIVLHAVPLP